jgi:hypothetical protein
MHPSVDTPSQLAAAEAGRIPTTLLEAMRFYGDPDVATRTLAAARWGDWRRVPALPFQGAALLHIHPPHLEVPESCRKQFSPKAGTIFEDSPIGLDRWLIAIWMVANSEQRVSSYKLHRLLGVTQTTAQFMLRRIRLAAKARKVRHTSDEKPEGNQAGRAAPG